MISRKGQTGKPRIQPANFGSANGNRTRILALKGLRANRCTIAPPGVHCGNTTRIRKIRRMHKRMRRGSDACLCGELRYLPAGAAGGLVRFFMRATMVFIA